MINEAIRSALAAHVVEGPFILAMSRKQATGAWAHCAQRASRGFYAVCSCGYHTDPGPRPGVDPGVTHDGSRLRAVVKGREHLAEQLTLLTPGGTSWR